MLLPVEALSMSDIDGIADSGMRANAPGMGEPNGEPLEVLSLDDRQAALFTSVGPSPRRAGGARHRRRRRS